VGRVDLRIAVQDVLGPVLLVLFPDPFITEEQVVVDRSAEWSKVPLDLELGVDETGFVMLDGLVIVAKLLMAEADQEKGVRKAGNAVRERPREGVASYVVPSEQGFGIQELGKCLRISPLLDQGGAQLERCMGRD